MKKAFSIGAYIGSFIGLIVALSMDLIIGESIGGGKNKAMADTLNYLLKTNLPPNHFLVFVGMAAEGVILVIFGAVMGGVCFMIVARFFSMLTDE